tara:strand:+ start:4115 stop:5581 length:1467 start_codon:yes stop_codon:yes gene_type:complete
MQTQHIAPEEEVKLLAAQCLESTRSARLLAIHTFDWWFDIIGALDFIVEPKAGTAGVDKYCRVYINPTWWATLTTRQRAGVVAHEALHPLMRHMERMAALGLSPRLGNIFADMEINDEPKLIELLDGIAGGILPVWCNANHGWRYQLEVEGVWMDVPTGKTMEWYARYWKEQRDEQEEEEDKSGPEGEPGLKSEEESDSTLPGDSSEQSDDSDQGESDSGGSEDSSNDGSSGKGSSNSPGVANGDCGSGVDGQERGYELPPPDESGVGTLPEDQEVIRQKIAIKAKSLTEKQRGDAPAGMLILLEQLLTPPKINWKRTFMSMFRNCDTWARGQYDKSYRVRSRREMPDCILPGDVEPVPDIAMVFDTSGSMSGEELRAAGSEAQGIMRTIDPMAKITYCCCDSVSYGVSKLTRISDLKVEGGGGTDMRVGIKATMEQRPCPDIIVVFTDGWTDWPEKAPRNVRIICCLVGRWVDEDTPDWMRTVRVED